MGSLAFPAVRGEEIFETAPYLDVSLLHYVEYGLTDRWTLITSGRPVGLSQYDERSTLYVGALNLGVRRGFGSGPLRFALEGAVGYQGPSRATPTLRRPRPPSFTVRRRPRSPEA